MSDLKAFDSLGHGLLFDFLVLEIAFLVLREVQVEDVGYGFFDGLSKVQEFFKDNHAIPVSANGEVPIGGSVPIDLD